MLRERAVSSTVCGAKTSHPAIVAGNNCLAGRVQIDGGNLDDVLILPSTKRMRAFNSASRRAHGHVQRGELP